MAEMTSPAPVLPPPTERYTLIGWAHKNLFSTWFKTLLTFLALGLIYALLKPIFTWVITQADWEVVQVNLHLLMVGQYPADEAWRVWLCMHLLAAYLGLTWGIWERRHRMAGHRLVVGAGRPFILPLDQ